GYNDNLVGGHPAADVLDPVSSKHPIVLFHSSGHRSVANTMAMREAGITDETADPPGGEIVRGKSGGATGEFLERVPEMVSLLERFPQADQRATKEAFQREFRMFARNGITSIADAGATPEQLNHYRSIMTEGMPVRIYAMVSDAHLPWVMENRGTPGWSDSALKIDTIKLFHGNSLSGRTAWLYKPYVHDPEYYGIPPGRSQKDLNELVQRIHNAGLQLAIHANGDREIDMVLGAIENAQAKNPRPDHRHRIEHGSVVNARILERFLTAKVSLAPHSYVLNHGEKMEEYGEHRWDWMHTNKSALDLGIPVGGNSDHSVSPPNVMERVQSMVTRRARSNGKIYGAAQRVTVHDAFWIWTMGSVYL
ncbi:MAG: amidohydrolase family protein, partial [Pseudomonadota bacterium]|nr:amidohydrolase family protein [Pseudomonadota bacterium]